MGRWAFIEKGYNYRGINCRDTALPSPDSIAGLIVGTRHCRLLIRLDSRGQLNVKMNKTNHKIYA